MPQEAEHFLAVQNKLGEGPIWDPQEQALYWVDIQNQRIYRYYPATGEHDVFDVNIPVTALALRTAGTLVMATGDGFAYWDPETEALDVIAHIEADKPHIRFNDGAVDRQGRFWAGTMNEEAPEAPDGTLYRLHPDGSVHMVETGFTVSNGMDWSPDNRIMYFTDTFRRVIYAFDYFDNGTFLGWFPLVIGMGTLTI